MAPEAILFPSIAMFLLTIGVFGRLGYMRATAAAKREVDPRYYKLYRGGEGEPDHLRVVSRHAQNHFEFPPLFHVVVVMTYVSGSVSALAVGLAWLYVLARAAHTAVHLGGNKVPRRFQVFIVGVSILTLLWLHLAWALIAR